MAHPTNGDIMKELGALGATLADVAEQTKKTNGRVTKIEEWKNAIQAVENYKKEQQPLVKANTVIMQQKWFQNDKLVGSVVAVLLAIAGAIGFFAGGGH